MQRFYDRMLEHSDIEKKRLGARVLKILYEKNLITPRSGNISFLSSNQDVINKYGKIFWISPGGTPKPDVSEKDFVPVTITGKILSNGKPSSELPMHMMCYQKTNAKALIHAHPIYTLIAAELNLLTRENLSEYYETKYLIGSDVEIIERIEPGSEELGLEVSEALKRVNIVVLLGHGVVAKGENLWVALDRVEALESLSKIILIKNIFKNR